MPELPVVCRAWLPLFMLSEQLWEEHDGLVVYDWSAYHAEGVFPPLKVEVFELRTGFPWVLEPGTAASAFYILDGNHRIRFFRGCGFIDAPAWVLDYRAKKDKGTQV